MDRYEEALERAKKGLPIDEVFPELKESEDERIRKGLLEIFNKAQFGEWGKLKIKDIIAWLKRQKEQQPAEWSEDIIRKAVKEIGLTQHQIDWFKDNVFPSKVEWSEEDERTLESFLGWLQGSMGEKTYSSWLKSLPERFRPQPKQEWSEEDENIYNKALDAIYYKDCNEKDDVISALNDLCDLISRKRKVIPPYAHWKPSKGQIEALEYFIRSWGESGTMSPQNPILCAAKSLLKDLKQL